MNEITKSMQKGSKLFTKITEQSIRLGQWMQWDNSIFAQ